MRKKIRIKIEPGGNLGEEVYCIDMYNEKDMKTEAITKKTEISFTGKKVDCLLDSTIRLKIRNPRVKKTRYCNYWYKLSFSRWHKK